MSMDRDQPNLVAAGVEVCCGLSKADLPQVQAVMHILIPLVGQAWDEMLDRIADDVAETQRDELGPEWIMTLGEVAFRGAFASWRPFVMSMFLQAAQVLMPTGERVATAAHALQFLVRSRLQEHYQVMLSLLSLRLPRPALRSRLTEVLGGPNEPWVRALVQSWAYGWHWVGVAYKAVQFKAGPARENTAFRYRNPLDDSTTAFCRWLVSSGKSLKFEDVRHQINGVERAVVENDLGLYRRAWPILDLQGVGSNDFPSIYQRNRVLLPPFHWSCRTEIEPA